jgi:hypothetical protein
LLILLLLPLLLLLDWKGYKIRYSHVLLSKYYK